MFYELIPHEILYFSWKLFIRIIVEAIPIIEDGEYKGDAIHREVGPLSLDKEIQNKA